jgi:hypothetical protein
MSWKPQQNVEGKWYSNGQAFATKEEAEKSAQYRFQNWWSSNGGRAIESDEPVNYIWSDEHGDVMIKEDECQSEA